MIIHCRATTPAPESQVAREVSALLAKRAALADPPASLVVSDIVALGIAELFRSPTLSGQVMDRLCRKGSIDSDELVDAARFEQDYASAEGHAALYCLVLWARNKAGRAAHAGRG